MNRDVFISFSAEDAAIAGRMCEVLECSGLNCWIAPRNILAGRKWSESIIEAIHAARVMVLVLSAHSNDSDQVEREVERAAHHRVPIIPFVIEKVAVSRALEYFISTPHWMNAYEPPIERHFSALAQTLKSLFEVSLQNRPRRWQDRCGALRYPRRPQRSLGKIVAKQRHRMLPTRSPRR